MDSGRATSLSEYTTERLLLRRFTADDAPFVLAVHQHPDLVRFVPSCAQRTLGEAQEWIASVIETQTPGRGWWCVVTADGVPIGAVVLKPIPPSAGHDQQDIEIGWRQHPSFTGHGYITEAAAAILTEAFGSGLTRVVAVTDPENVRSQRVCQRLGMTHLGSTHRYYDQQLELFVATAD
ncbi:GNAT family N-acetyltransferase [Flexivirga caeni]|uniref:N-acetyltransferase n=1 Tax=Flexivirga caeni TaxID=2294115 RepID=A0A3M9M536_9MICO|nr:GNAT family N-acetyltransferase [Flexivirga caeni]RNI19648.1 N-acetyltransferase [Flexivirga caeni]